MESKDDACGRGLTAVGSGDDVLELGTNPVVFYDLKISMAAMLVARLREQIPLCA